MSLWDRRRRRGATPRPALTEPPIGPVGQDDRRAGGWQRDGELLAGFAAFPGAVILDAGCGDAPHSAFFAGQDVTIILADVLPDSVALAAAATARAGSAATVRELVTDCAPLPLPDASVDRVVATEVLEHVPDPAAFLAELVRVSKPGALLLLSVPDARSEELQRPFAAPDYFVPPNHVRVFAEGQFQALVRDAGLSIEHRQFDGFYQSLWWSFFWVSAQPEVKEPWHPLLAHWMRTWAALLATDRGPELKAALDAVIPKSEVIVARKD